MASVDSETYRANSKIISLHVSWLSYQLGIENELLGRRGRGTRCEGIRQCRNYGATKKKGKQARRDHRAETRTARFVGWKLVIKIPAVALVRENVERERESETKNSKGVSCARRSTDSCVQTSAAFKPRSAFKLVAVPIRTCIYMYIYVRIYTHHRLCFPTRHVALTARAVVSSPPFKPSITFDSALISLSLIK